MTGTSETVAELYDQLLAEARLLATEVASPNSGASRNVRSRGTSLLSVAGLRRASIDADLIEAGSKQQEDVNTASAIPTEAEMMAVIIRAV